MFYNTIIESSWIFLWNLSTTLTLHDNFEGMLFFATGTHGFSPVKITPPNTNFHKLLIGGAIFTEPIDSRVQIKSFKPIKIYIKASKYLLLRDFTENKTKFKDKE